MRNFFAVFFAATTLVTAPSLSFAQTPDAAPNSAIDDTPEFMSLMTLSTDYLLPMSANMTRMGAYMAIEPQKACDAATLANQQAVDGLAFYQSEKKRLTAANQTTETLDSMGQTFEQLPDVLSQTKQAACAPEALANTAATADAIAISPVLLHLADTIDDMTLGLRSDMRGDTKTACQGYLKAEKDLAAAQKSLEAAKTVVDTATLADLDIQVADLKSQIQEQVTACKAS